MSIRRIAHDFVLQINVKSFSLQDRIECCRVLQPASDIDHSPILGLDKSHPGGSLWKDQSLPESHLTDRMTRFRPCIDLHAGQVKQIVGGTLDSSVAALQTNYVSSQPPAYFSKLSRDNDLSGAARHNAATGEYRSGVGSFAGMAGRTSSWRWNQ